MSRPEHTELVARSLGVLGADRAWVVHGAGGLDEISTLGHTKVSELVNGTVNTFYLHPFDVGLASCDREALAGGTAAENAAMVERLLDGERGPRRDIVLLNAAAALLVAGKAASLKDGLQRAAGSVDQGARNRYWRSCARCAGDVRRRARGGHGVRSPFGDRTGTSVGCGN